MSLAVVPLAASVSHALHSAGATMLYLTIDSVLGVTVYLTVYRLRIILGSRRGWFDIVELSLSRTSCIVVFGRPSRQPKEPIHGEWTGANWRSQLALLHLPVRHRS